MTGKAKILAVDDKDYNLKMYRMSLEENGYDVETALNGRLAVKAAIKNLPDAILLDVMMPVMDGLKACRIIKKDKRTKDIPIIIVSAKSSLDDIISGLKAGANEYLIKPFHNEELLLRVKNVVALKRTHDQLKKINSNLEAEVNGKTEMLVEAGRFELIGKMASGLGHDLTNLLTGIVGYNRLIKTASCVELAKKYAEKQFKSLNLCTNFIDNLLNFSKVQKPFLTEFDPREGIETTLGILSSNLKHRSIEYEIIEEEKTVIYGDEGQFTQVCLNIISNALDALGKGGKIFIKIRSDGNFTMVSFADNGPGIKKKDICKIYDYLFTTKGERKSTGIGLHTTKNIIEGLNGEIKVESKLRKGTIFTIYLPNNNFAKKSISQTSP